MPNKNIRVDGGLVTSRDPALLSDGELTRADDAYYKPNDPALWKRKAQVAFNATAETKITGIRFLQFDGSDPDMFVASGQDNYRQAIAGETGTFSDIANLVEDATTLALSSITEDVKLDSVHYNNRHFLLNGVDRNRVIVPQSERVAASLVDGTMIWHGMLTQDYAPTLSRDAGIGAGMTMASGSTLTYWFEERVKENGVIVKRSPCTSEFTTTLTGDGTTDKPQLTRSSKTNPDATHWALFSTAINGAFPVGAEIVEHDFGTLVVNDERTGSTPALPSGATYESMEVTIVGVTTIVPKNGTPPNASTGDVFEDSLVLNDISDLRVVKYSVEDTPHSFPSINVIRFETKEQDEVRLIRRLGNAVMVAMRDSLWRINILPRPEDSSFETTRVKDEIDGAFGCVGALAGDTFSFGGGNRLAYISPYGVVVTDGGSWDILTDDLDWQASVNVEALSAAVLINNPEFYRLEAYVPGPGSTVNNRAYYLHYHPSHAKRSDSGNLRAKVTGPISVRAIAVMGANLSGQKKIFTARDGVVYQEGANEAGTGIAFVCRTGDIYLNGVGGEAELRTVRVHHGAYEGQDATVRLISRNEGDSDVASDAAISLDYREATQASITGQGETYQVGVENSDALGEISVNGMFMDYLGPNRSEEG